MTGINDIPDQIGFLNGKSFPVEDSLRSGIQILEVLIGAENGESSRGSHDILVIDIVFVFINGRALFMRVVN